MIVAMPRTLGLACWGLVVVCVSALHHRYIALASLLLGPLLAMGPIPVDCFHSWLADGVIFQSKHRCRRQLRLHVAS